MISPSDLEEAPKHLQVRASLMAAIRGGEFAPGDRLPSERDVAARYGVSYMTARRAITEMVEADLLERRPNIGTFVRAHGSRRLEAVTVNLIYPLGQSSFADQFLQSSVTGTKSRGWHYHLLPLQTGRERSAVRALESGEPAILMSLGLEENSPLYQAIANAQGRAVTIGNQLSNHAAPAVMADDAHAMRLIMRHLRSMGHRSIGYITNFVANPIELERAAIWKEQCSGEMTPEQTEQRQIRLPTYAATPDKSRVQQFYEQMCEHLARPDLDVTALICAGDTTALATLAACRHNGYDVPEKMSLVTIGDGMAMEFHNPPVTCVDVHVDRHVEIALQLIEETLGGAPSPQRLHIVEPTLIERGTVAQLA